MTTNNQTPGEQPTGNTSISISDKDIYEAMKNIPGYLDISPADFRELYLLALDHARERLYENLRVGEIMTKEVFSVLPETPLAEVASVMARHQVSGLPVVENDGAVVGIITEQDFFIRMGDEKQTSCMGLIASCLRTKGCAAVSIGSRMAADIMHSPVVTASPQTLIADAVQRMKDNSINRMPVIDAQGRLVGIFTRHDVVHALACRCTP